MAETLAKVSFANRSSDISIYRVWKNQETNYTSLVTRFDEKNSTWEEICDDLGIVQEARIIEQLQSRIDEQLKEIKSSTLSSKQQKRIYEDLRSEYEECLEKLESAQFKMQEFVKPILIVEDIYESIYKIGYLKCKNIEFTKETLDEVFLEKASFVIRRAGGAGKVGGFLSMETTDGYEDKKVVGLFDYDYEGCENFYHLKRRCNNEWSDEIQGTKKTGFY